MIKNYKFISSPNFKSGRHEDVDMIVLHYTSSDEKTAINWFLTKEFKDKAGKVKRNYASAHYVVSRDGSVTGMVDPSDTAWHAGLSSYDRRKFCNGRSIGIEIVNWGLLKKNKDDLYTWTKAKYTYGDAFCDTDGKFWAGYTDEQYLACAELCKDLIRRYPKIEKEKIIGHEDISGPEVRKDYKLDPGPAWDWQRLLRLVFPEGDDGKAGGGSLLAKNLQLDLAKRQGDRSDGLAVKDSLLTRIVSNFKRCMS